MDVIQSVSSPSSSSSSESAPNIRDWGKENAPDDFVDDMESAQVNVQETFDRSFDSEIGQSKVDDARGIALAVSRVISESKQLAASSDGTESAAAVLVDAKRRLDNIAPSTNAKASVVYNSEILVKELLQSRWGQCWWLR